MSHFVSKCLRYRWRIVAGGCLAIVVFAIAVRRIVPTAMGVAQEPAAHESATKLPQTSQASDTSSDSLPSRISISASQITKSGIRTTKVTQDKFAVEIKLTGRVSLNEDRLAHIFPVVNGQVETVRVGLGDLVKEGDTLVTVHSREVGNAKLDLFQARLALELAQLKQKLQQEINQNTSELLTALKSRQPITDIQERFAGRAMGDYRDKLLASYSGYLKSDADVDRLSDVASTGAVSSKQLAWAKASRDADQATFLAKVEQVDYELKTSLLQATQLVKEAETKVAVITTNLKIMGCQAEEIVNIDPASQGEEVSAYAIRAPLQGTIIAKDVVLREQIRPDTQIMAIADLSTVWIEAHVYEKDLPLLESIKGKTLKVRNAAWPNRQFEAQIFYTGEIMEENTRTVPMRAIVKNTDRILKPGMFVSIEFSASENDESVLQVPSHAILDYEGKSFVFVQSAEGEFERHDVRVGPKNDKMIVVEEGLKTGDAVVVAGGFILKSKMLENLLGEE